MKYLSSCSSCMPHLGSKSSVSVPRASTWVTASHNVTPSGSRWTPSPSGVTVCLSLEVSVTIDHSSLEAHRTTRHFIILCAGDHASGNERDFVLDGFAKTLRWLTGGPGAVPRAPADSLTCSDSRGFPEILGSLR